MTSWTPPVTDNDRPDPWDLMAAEASKRWRRAHPVRAVGAALVALWRRRRGRRVGLPPALELVERKPYQAMVARYRWLLHLHRLSADPDLTSEIDQG